MVNCYLDDKKEEEVFNMSCRECGRTDLPLHYNRLCPECYKICDICNGEALFKTENEHEISGDTCANCDQWVCQNCIDYRYMAETLTVEPICVECADWEREEDRKEVEQV